MQKEKRVHVLKLLPTACLVVLLILAAQSFSPSSIPEQGRQKVHGTGFLPVSYAEDNLPPRNFSLIVLPDAQGYSETYPWIFDNQTQRKQSQLNAF